MPGLYSHTTRATGTTLTAAIYNGDHQNHIDNLVPSMIDDYSDNVTQMRAVTSPGGVGSESLATTLAGDIERLRYVIKDITGGAQWYSAATTLARLASNNAFTGNNTFAGTSEFNETVTISKDLLLTGILTPAQITSDQNNYAPTGHADATTFRLSVNADRTITGLAGGVAGRVVTIINTGGGTITLSHESGSSTDVNRFAIANGVTAILDAIHGACKLAYDGTTNRWRVVWVGYGRADVAQLESPNSSFHHIVTPGLMQYHPAHAKIVGEATVSGGTPTLVSGVSFNTTSITDTATGRLSINQSVANSSANAKTVVGLVAANSGDNRNCMEDRGARAAGVFALECDNTGGTLVDPLSWGWASYGDLA